MKFNKGYYKENTKATFNAFLKAKAIADKILELDFEKIERIEYKANTRDQHWYYFKGYNYEDNFYTEPVNSEVDKALNQLIPLQKRYCKKMLDGIKISGSTNPFKSFK